MLGIILFCLKEQLKIMLLRTQPCELLFNGLLLPHFEHYGIKCNFPIVVYRIYQESAERTDVPFFSWLEGTVHHGQKKLQLEELVTI